MNAYTGRAILGGLLPIISNPAILAAVGIGAAGWIIYSKLADTDENREIEAVPNGSEPFDEPYEAVYETVDATVPERLETVSSTAPETVGSTVDEPLWDNLGIKKQQSPAPNVCDEEQAKKDMIRQAMSELGKRSAAARSQRKKAAQQPT